MLGFIKHTQSTGCDAPPHTHHPASTINTVCSSHSVCFSLWCLVVLLLELRCSFWSHILELRCSFCWYTLELRCFFWWYILELRCAFWWYTLELRCFFWWYILELRCAFWWYILELRCAFWWYTLELRCSFWWHTLFLLQSVKMMSYSNRLSNVKSSCISRVNFAFLG